MNYLKSKVNLAIAFFALGSCLIACNNGNTSSDVSDTATTYKTGPDTTMNADTSTSQASADTSSMKSTDASANKNIAKTSTSKKKGKASVGITPEAKNHKIAMDKSGVYNYSEVMPAYPGGQSAIDNYVNNNIEYPQLALDDGKEGRIGVAFTVDENGKVDDAHAVGNKLGDGLDEEALRIVSSMRGWTPGTVKGKPVKTKMTLPIIFKIEE